MRLMLVLLLLLAGCADGTNLTGDSPGPGQGHGDGAGSEGGQADGGGRVCNAAVETMSGRATYVGRSAVEPEMVAPFHEPQTCGDYVAALTPTGGEVNVVNGMIGDTPVMVVGSAPTDGTCVYMLRATSPAKDFARPCAVAVDYSLTVQ